MDTVGVIGLGAMGRPSARHLLGGGYRVVAYDVKAELVEAVRKGGAQGAGSPREVGALSGLTLVSVADDAQVTEVCLGTDGILAGARRGSVIAILSSGSPEPVERLEAGPRPKWCMWGATAAEVCGGCRCRSVAHARMVASYVGVRELGLPIAHVARALGITPPVVHADPRARPGPPACPWPERGRPGGRERAKTFVTDPRPFRYHRSGGWG